MINKQIQEGEQNDLIISQVLRDEIKRAMDLKNSFAEDLINELPVYKIKVSA